MFYSANWLADKSWYPPLSFPGIPSDKSAKIALILFSRCLEHGKWPDRIEFTKYLYLLDYAVFRLTGSKATDVRWKFYHYGPWSEDVISLMDNVQGVFRLGWIDYASAEDRPIPEFDPITEKLPLALESLINRILNAFACRDASLVVDYCYRLTEPMQKALRGQLLDFSTIPITDKPPIFVSEPRTIPMPQLSASQLASRDRFKSMLAVSRSKYDEWKRLMDCPAYHEAMETLANEQEVAVGTSPEGVKVGITDEALAEFDDIRDE